MHFNRCTIETAVFGSKVQLSSAKTPTMVKTLVLDDMHVYVGGLALMVSAYQPMFFLTPS